MLVLDDVVGEIQLNQSGEVACHQFLSVDSPDLVSRDGDDFDSLQRGQ